MEVELSRSASSGGFRFEPATPSRWSDIETLFGPRGACAGCWCMWARLTGTEFKHGKGEGNRRALRSIVAAGDPPGIIAYDGKDPIGWCALAPRERYRRFERSRVLAPVDAAPVWSVVCFFVARSYRGQGLSVRLLREAVEYARGRGATILEGYPVEPSSDRTADAFAWTGLASAFLAAGFREVTRRSPTRPIMRFAIGGRRPRSGRREAPARRRASRG